MAAATQQGAKLSKKTAKKLVKVSKNLSEKEKVVTTSEPSKVLCVQNAGLGNDVSQDELLPLFTTFGTVVGIVMIPKKQYCFVCFAEERSASQCLNELNGHVLRKGKDPSQDVVLYLLYVDKAPSSVSPSFELPPGLIIKEEFVDEQLENDLMELMTEGTSRESGQMKHRQVKHFGYEFKYNINDVDITEPLPEGIPDVCQPVLDKALEQDLIKQRPDQLTINMYRPGQGIPPHIDTREAFEDGIMSLSLGSQVVMDFRHPDGRHLHVLIPRRSLLIMTGDSRYVWSHGITPRKSDIVTSHSGGGLTLKQRETRISFTFRKCVMDRSKVNFGTVENGSKDKPSCSLPANDEEAVTLEREHVHKVYEDIANHFSGTRYKPWPRVLDFLMEQPPHSLLADVGCGNGKCLGHNKSLFEIGSDYSSNLASICRSRGFQTCVADVCSLPFRSCVFDVVLCIAVVHHMATESRRHRALCELVRILRPGGKALVYVWAMEQELNQARSKYINTSKLKRCGEEGEDAVSYSCVDHEKNKDEPTSSGDTEAVKDSSLSPSLSRKKQSQSAHADKPENDVVSKVSADTVEREKKETARIEMKPQNTEGDYHISQDLELVGIPEGNVTGNTGSREAKTINKPLHVHVNRTPFREQDMLVPWQLKGKSLNLKNKKDKDASGDGNGEVSADSSPSGEAKVENSPQLFHRFYHVFKEGELETLCKQVPGCVAIKSYHDQGNWCVVLEKV